MTDDRTSFEEWLRERFQARSHDLLRNPADKSLYADPAMQFAFDAFEAGLLQGRREPRHSVNQTSSLVWQIL